MDPILPVGIRVNTATAFPATPANSEADRLKETARELEGVFLGLLMKAMRSTVGNGGLFKEGTDTQTYRDMFDQEIGRSMARAGGIGLAQLVLRDQALREAADAGRRRRDGNEATQPSKNIGKTETGGSVMPDSNPCENSSQVLSTDDR
jgi:Rod binding domain-containing protein